MLSGLLCPHTRFTTLVYWTCTGESLVKRPEQVANAEECGYTEYWEGRSRLLQRWGALLPLGPDQPARRDQRHPGSKA